MDPKGSLPSTIVNSVVQEIPNCVVNVIKWVHNEGLIPYVSSPTPDSAIKSIFRLETYSHNDSKTYQLSILCPKEGEGEEELEIKIDNEIKYKNGYDVRLEGDDGVNDWTKLEQEPSVLKVTFTPEAAGKKLEIIISAK